IGTLILKSGIKANSTAVEIGIGSGFLTVSLLYYLHNGKLISYDISKRNAENVLEIIRRFGMDKRWEFKIRDLREGIDENNLDAIFLDVPEPWLNIEKTLSTLKIGGTFVAYLPNITQVRELLNNFEKFSFGNAEIIEIIERPWVYGNIELRPQNIGLLHTSFMVFLRKF
ncbi:MAG: protein methyltransferase, partial [Thermoplasmata archaeon]